MNPRRPAGGGKRKEDSPFRHWQSALVVVGASQGGLEALATLLRGLHPEFPWPVVIVQHRGKDTVRAVCQSLQIRTGRHLEPAGDKAAILGSRIYVAPPDYHLLIERDHFALSLEAPVHHARPSVDVLFESAAADRGAAVCAVILTGATADGAAGAARVQAAGGCVLVQDPGSAEAGAMPEAALTATPGARVLPLEEISRALNELAAAAGLVPGVSGGCQEPENAETAKGIG